MNDKEKKELLDSILDQMYIDKVGEYRLCFNLPAKNIIIKKLVQEPSFQKEIRLT